MKLAKFLIGIGAVSIALIWIPFGILMLNGAGKGRMFSNSFLNRDIWVGLILLFIFSTIFFVSAGLIVRAIAKQKIVTHGRKAEARIIKVSQTGAYINHQPQLKFLLEVQAKGLSPFKAEVKEIVSLLDISSYQPGCILRVSFDPKTRNVVVLGPKNLSAGMQNFGGRS